MHCIHTTLSLNLEVEVVIFSQYNVVALDMDIEADGGRMQCIIPTFLQT